MPWGLHTKDTPGQGRILIVDDEDDVRKVLRLTLTKAGYDVVEADHGGKGIEVIGADDNALMVDVIICDIRMPKINGVEALLAGCSGKKEPAGDKKDDDPIPQTKDADKRADDGAVKPADKDKLLESVASAIARRLALRDDH